MFASVISFALGVYLAIRVIAALFRVIDLWYAIGRELSGVLRGVAVWGGATIIVALVAGSHRGALLGGLLGYAIFYLGLFLVMRLVMRPRSTREWGAPRSVDHRPWQGGAP